MRCCSVYVLGDCTSLEGIPDGALRLVFLFSLNDAESATERQHRLCSGVAVSG